ncbi:uncharacterized protein LOC129764190 [Toxorhynchites rutilus septentrionalis]|uniref:uncharacterized protein LOC129764190 n=1 Tax=Toxorhynchites rutilus septentrionalis TaxID=329112 RepID=UPI00247A34E6|nr:uncharacterized protein LOC129764190 [Toxorhynchites rutilus septentrionalis]
MNCIRIDRCVLPLAKTNWIQLIGFCDASQKGYGACLYVRSRNEEGELFIQLLCSKSRVAPSKNNRTTIPRLELCGALMLAQLVEQVKTSLPIKFDQIRLWLDSTIVLSWINTCPSKLEIFVSNRVSKIRNATDPACWSHVSTQDNPADLVSRGVMPYELEGVDLWWRGPSFLKKPEDTWSEGVKLVPEEFVPELMAITAMPVVVERFRLFDDCSEYYIMVRVVARIKRMFQNYNAKFRRNGIFSAEEIRQAKLVLVRLAQRECFPEVFKELKNQVTTRNQSLRTLSPFVDNRGVIRVGGRLSKSCCSFDTKHQMILPARHPLTTAVIRAVHKINLHAGVHTTLCAIRREFWIIRGRSTVKKEIRDCIICFRSAPKLISQYMGDLPACRLEGEYPFLQIGIDFCGPVFVKQRNKRSTVEHKAWIALFICLATKAIHLELVSEMSTAAFLTAFDRFVSRRGKPTTVWTDNGTNFVGAANLFREWEKFFNRQENQNEIQHSQGNSIEWRFNPPEASHFGGIWEANIRQTKALLVKQTGGAALSFEEMSTVLARIEAVLNSRPITQLSDDPEDLEPLTPGNFLIFRPVTAVARPEVKGRNHPRSRFDHITAIVQHFWSRFQLEYISSLQERFKWHKKVAVKIGQLVLVKKDNMPVQKWLLGRITETFAGKDGVVRVVNIKTQNGIMKRAVSKLCFLPIDPDQSLESCTFQRAEDVREN